MPKGCKWVLVASTVCKWRSQVHSCTYESELTGEIRATGRNLEVIIHI